MGRRLDLHNLLLELMPEGQKHVYFQPPENVKMQYPCIVYNRDAVDTKFADNSPYSRTKRYQATVITRDPDSEIPDAVAKLTFSTFSRFFVVDDLNHDIYNIYF
jgi:hypothetical protein